MVKTKQRDSSMTDSRTESLWRSHQFNFDMIPLLILHEAPLLQKKQRPTRNIQSHRPFPPKHTTVYEEDKLGLCILFAEAHHFK